jgi:hypothetical protein
MFNEILTGKASLDPQPKPLEPFREAGELPPVTETCVGCGRSFKAPANRIATHCASCMLQIAELNAANDRMAFVAAEAEAQRKQNSQRLFSIIGGIVVVAGLIVFKAGMRSQMREDAAVGAGYKSYDEYKELRDEIRLSPNDEFSSRLSDFASDMCRCKDLQCARDIQATLTNFTRTHSPSDDQSNASARVSLGRLADCQQTIEAGGVPAE